MSIHVLMSMHVKKCNRPVPCSNRRASIVDEIIFVDHTRLLSVGLRPVKCFDYLTLYPGKAMFKC